MKCFVNILVENEIKKHFRTNNTAFQTV